MRESLAEGHRKLDRIRALGRNIQRPEMARSLAEVCTIIEKILSTIADQPKKLSLASNS